MIYLILYISLKTEKCNRLCKFRSFSPIDKEKRFKYLLMEKKKWQYRDIHFL